MKLNDEQMRALWQSADAGGLSSGPCLAEEFILRAGQNKLSDNEQATLQAHLPTCPSCVEAYLIAQRTYAWATETVALTQPKAAPTRHITRKTQNRWLAVSASLILFACIGLGIWSFALLRERQAWQDIATRQQNELARLPDLQAQIAAIQNQQTQANQTLSEENNRLRQSLAQLTQPQLEVPIIDADPANLSRGAMPTTVTRVEVPATSEFFTLILHLNQESAAKKFLLKWRNAQGRLLWQRELTKDSSPNVTLMLSRQQVPAGRYRVQLMALQNQRHRPLDHYEVEVIYRTAH